MGMLRQIQGTFLGQAKFGKPGLGLRQVDVQFHYGPSVVTNIDSMAYDIKHGNNKTLLFKLFNIF